MKKIIIAGGGIIGCAIARELLLKGRGEVLLLEKEDRLGCHSSGRNSGVIHSGINHSPQSLKGQMALKGSAMLRKYCQEVGVPCHVCGTLVLAFQEDQIQTLDKIYHMAMELGVPGVRLLSSKEVGEYAPGVSCLKGLFSPTGAIVDSEKLVQSIGQDILKLGGEICYQEKVIDYNAPFVLTEKRPYQCDFFINCTGLYADKVAKKSGFCQNAFIVPFRGEYQEILEKKCFGMVYEVPDLRFPFLKVHLTNTFDGSLLAGPTAVLSFGRESYCKEIHLRETFDYLKEPGFYRMGFNSSFIGMAFEAFRMSFSTKAFTREVRKFFPGSEKVQLKTYRSGIRAQLVSSKGLLINDLVVEKDHQSLHVLNCVSPGMTCSMAFAQYIESQLEL